LSGVRTAVYEERFPRDALENLSGYSGKVWAKPRKSLHPYSFLTGSRGISTAITGKDSKLAG
jgi:hypothetical protein